MKVPAPSNSEQSLLTADDFRTHAQQEAGSAQCHTQAGEMLAAGAGESMTLDELERLAISKAIEKHSGNLSLVAKELGISRGALYRKIEKHGL